MAWVYNSTLSAIDSETGQTAPVVNAVSPDQIGQEADSSNVYAIGGSGAVSSSRQPDGTVVTSLTGRTVQDQSNDKIATTVTSLGTALLNAGAMLGSSFLSTSAAAKGRGPSIFGMFQPAPPPQPKRTSSGWMVPVVIGGAVVAVVFFATRRSSSSSSVRRNPSKKKKTRKTARRSAR